MKEEKTETYYQRRKAKRLCTICGEPLPPGRTIAKCEKCCKAKAADSRADYNFFKAHGICTRCKRRPARPGLTWCKECSEARRRTYYANKEKAKNSL